MTTDKRSVFAPENLSEQCFHYVEVWFGSSGAALLAVRLLQQTAVAQPRCRRQAQPHRVDIGDWNISENLIVMAMVLK